MTPGCTQSETVENIGYGMADPKWQSFVSAFIARLSAAVILCVNLHQRFFVRPFILGLQWRHQAVSFSGALLVEIVGQDHGFREVPHGTAQAATFVAKPKI